MEFLKCVISILIITYIITHTSLKIMVVTKSEEGSNYIQEAYQLEVEFIVKVNNNQCYLF